MSSLAASRADNYYYPPEWTPDQGGINKFQKSHPLGKRARKLDEGILVVRFEMPFNVWCTTCETHIGKGVRYNAEKKKAGKYFSTTIWEFSMRCTDCKGEMVIQTDPQNCTYKMVSGVRKKEEDFDPEAAETLKLGDEETKKKLAENPFYRLEHEEQDKAVSRARSKEVLGLLKVQEVLKDDYSANQKLRQAMRSKKKAVQARAQEARSLGLSVPLLEPVEADSLQAKRVKFPKQSIPLRQGRASSRQRIAAQSIFSTSSSSSSSTSRAAIGPILGKIDPTRFRISKDNVQPTLATPLVIVRNKTERR